MKPSGKRARAVLRACAIAALVFAAPAAPAGEADVIAAKARRGGDGKWSFAVTIRSNDQGWKYYCDRFEVRAPDGRTRASSPLPGSSTAWQFLRDCREC